MNTYSEIQRIFEYSFINEALPDAATFHPSNTTYDKHATVTYEKLELLGDAVLSLVISEILFKTFPTETEGDLSRRRAGLVSGNMVSRIAERLGAGSLLQLSPGEDKNQGKQNKSNLANLMEAIIGAVYLDGGMEKAREVIHRIWLPYVNEDTTPLKDPKSRLQEIAQAEKINIPTYKVINKSGPDHDPLFTVEVCMNDVTEQATARSKKEAEMLAAESILNSLTGNL